ncbi:TetR family transcriptional regulator (plasmid) [Streptantibioticus cattleyicolor NRRL 8057 = DSM 46488]|uniref:TetR family transcriptional regulator n=2 Tax=Streptantibioticus cattleyicolor TaxID=29303 RepID=G8XFX1_STREN|nr:TetR family transcriptional regulator [Streptantibioticus cattleyicolor NRRL 8057 = DSM 46488]
MWMRERERAVRPQLSEEKIVRCAIEMADADGIDALSMRRIATRLGTGTTSLYRHITGKEELIELMVDAVHGEHPAPAATGDDWRAQLADAARGFRAALLRHPWLAQQAARRPALGPNVVARTDRVLGIAALATDDPTLAGMVVELVNTYVLGHTGAELAELEAQRATGMTENEWRESVGVYVRQVVESGRYPHFNRRVLEADDPDADARFEFGLHCLLTGIAALVDRR